MKCFKISNILKISIISVLLILCIGSIYAADNSSFNSLDSQNFISISDFDEIDIDADLDDDSDDWGYYDDSDNDNDDSDDWDDYDDYDDSDNDDDDSDDSDDYWDDWDDWDENWTLSDFDDYYDAFYNYWKGYAFLDGKYDNGIKPYEHLKFKVISYLARFGNPDENWTESEEFLNEYQLYLENPGNCALNESDENYDLYLKIYDSIVSTFGEYNLTQNETAYLNFLSIFYLNHYANCTNETWDDIGNFTDYYPLYFMSKSFMCFGSATSDSNDVSASGSSASSIYGVPLDYGNHLYNALSAADLNSNPYTNSTSTELNNSTIPIGMGDNNPWYDLLAIFFAILFMALTII